MIITFWKKKNSHRKIEFWENWVYNLTIILWIIWLYYQMRYKKLNEKISMQF